LSSASSGAKQIINTPYKQQTGNWLCFFSVGAMVKGYQPYQDSWATVLGEMPCQWEVDQPGRGFLTCTEGKKGVICKAVCMVNDCWVHPADAKIRIA